MENLVNWPHLGEDSIWRDSGEGGLFAYAVWDASEEHCTVDVYPSFGVADVRVSAIGPMREDFREFDRAARSRDLDDYPPTISFGTVISLGSTGSSLYSDRLGTYFEVDGDALTESGRSLVAALTAVYGEPTFVTFLDT